MRNLAGLCAGLLALACSSGAAFAQTPTTIAVKPITGSSANVAGQSDASSNFHYRDVMEGLTSGGAPEALTMDADLGAWMHVTNWPATFGISGSLPAGTAILGKTGIDQTTPGVTNGVQDGADTSVAAGAAPAKSQLGAVQYNSTSPTLTSGQTVAAQGDINGNLKVNVQAGSVGLTGQLPGFASTPAFTISGSLPGFASPPSVSLTGSLPAFASTPAFTISGSLPGFASTPAFSISGTLPGFASVPAFKAQDSGGGDATDTVNHAVKVNCVTGCGGAGAVTQGAGNSANRWYTSQQDSGGGDATDTTNHAVKVNCIVGCSGGGSVSQGAGNSSNGWFTKQQDSGGGDATDTTHHAVKVTAPLAYTMLGVAQAYTLASYGSLPAAYAANQLVCNNATTCTAQTISFPLGGGHLTGFRIWLSDTGAWNYGSQFTIKVWSSNPSINGGDHAAYALNTGYSKYWLADFNCVMNQPDVDGITGQCNPNGAVPDMPYSSVYYEVITTSGSNTPSQLSPTMYVIPEGTQ